MTVRNDRGHKVVAPDERPNDLLAGPLTIGIHPTPLGVVECDYAAALRSLMPEIEKLPLDHPVRRAAEELSRQRAELKKLATTLEQQYLAALAYAVARNEVALVHRVSGRDTLTYIGAETKEQHHNRSRKAAATKHKDREKNTRKLEDEVLGYRRRRPQLSERSMAAALRSQGIFDREDGTRPSLGACRQRLRRAVPKAKRRAKS